MKLILLGAPGAGKGTLAERLIRALSIPSISTGNILREQVAAGTELGRSAKEYMDAGKLVPDEIVIGMLAQRVQADDCQNGYILDGFPRTIPQAEALDGICQIDSALNLEVPDEVITARMTGRRVCLKCGATYHLVNMPPKVDGVCDKCGDNLVIRKDDAPEVVADRLRTYHEQTEPLKDYYAAQGKLRTIDGTQSIEKTLELALAALGKSE